MQEKIYIRRPNEFPHFFIAKSTCHKMWQVNIAHKLLLENKFSKSNFVQFNRLCLHFYVYMLECMYLKRKGAVFCYELVGQTGTKISRTRN